MEPAAPSVGLQASSYPVRDRVEIARAIDGFAAEPRPAASRADSAELYVLATGFRGVR
jgi:hypothetical protein